MAKAPKTNDIDLRLAVTRALLDAGYPREAIRHEITLDSSSSDGRADMVLATDRALIGIEIKSGKDTLERLESQRERYGARFDRMALVIDERHAPADYAAGQAMRFGVIRIFAGGRLLDRWDDDRSRHLPTWGDAPWVLSRYPVRSFGATERMSPHAMLSMLWADEALTIAAELVASGAVPPTGGGQRYRVVPHLAEHASIAQLRPRIAAALRSRKLNRWEEAFWAKFDAMQDAPIEAAA